MRYEPVFPLRIYYNYYIKLACFADVYLKNQTGRLLKFANCLNALPFIL